MKDLWLKLGCYITGYNYAIIKNSSEASAKTVKKYLSAILIVSILWGFIGYTFAGRYLHTGVAGSSVVSLVMIIIVIQIERQIILSIGRNSLVPVFRTLIGIVMAVIGSVIIDQIIFREDVEKVKISNLQMEVDSILPVKTRELDLQLRQLDSAIAVKENERAALIDEITKKPFIKSASSETRHFQMQRNSATGTMRDTLVKRTDLALNDVVNPKASLLPDIEDQISQLRSQKNEKENNKINIREALETELGSKTGFLDELKILFSILLSSWIAMVVWSMFFLFLMSIEVLVLVNKFGEEKTDYESIILHQKDVRIKMLDKLTE
ncbi:MAG TPA: DUF4407 domain-containing protein [Bacteroidales bacterium]|nr:DUF4407 domain-containing protein [Bacteroidales bacterium]